MNDHAADGRDDMGTSEAGEPRSEHPDPTAEAGPTAATTQDPGEQPGQQSETEQLQDDLAQANERLLRMAAELDNVRKRSQREVENAHRFGIERFAQALLPVIDSFEAALNAKNLELDSLLEGQQATLRLLEQAFGDAGIESIDPAGEPFDPQVHEAISMLPAPAAEPDSVIDVIQKGYRLQARLLRPARVVVAKAPE